jgi:hypothetical protein
VAEKAAGLKEILLLIMDIAVDQGVVDKVIMVRILALDQVLLDRVMQVELVEDYTLAVGVAQEQLELQE